MVVLEHSEVKRTIFFCTNIARKSEMESSRPWPSPQGASRTTGHVLGLGFGGQVLGLGLENMYLLLIIFALCA